MNSEQIDLLNRIPQFLLDAALYVERHLLKAGFEVYLVGGSVRDLLLNRRISDLDFTTNATPDQMKKVFPRTIPVGEKFGTILVLYRHHPLEVTTYRSDGQYNDGRRPDSVSFGHSLYEDVMRRDFTINGMAYQISKKLLIDHVEGKKDIAAGIIRTIGDPMARFKEDGLRPIRGCRIMATLGFKLDAGAETAMAKNIDVISRIAPERFYDEWRKTLKIRSKHDYWNAIKKTGIFSLFFSDFKQLNFNETKWNNLMQAIEHSMPGNMGIYIAHFIYQEYCSENKYALNDSTADHKPIRQFSKDFFERNRFPMKVQKLCMNLITSPLLDALDQRKPGCDNSLTIKQALSQLDFCDWLYHLRFCKEILYRHISAMGTSDHAVQEFHDTITEIVQVIRQYRKKKFVLYLSELNLTGDDVKSLGFQGKQIGDVLKKCLNYVIQNPEKNNPEELKNYINI